MNPWCMCELFTVFRTVLANGIWVLFQFMADHASESINEAVWLNSRDRGKSACAVYCLKIPQLCFYMLPFVCKRFDRNYPVELHLESSVQTFGKERLAHDGDVIEYVSSEVCKRKIWSWEGRDWTYGVESCLISIRSLHSAEYTVMCESRRNWCRMRCLHYVVDVVCIYFCPFQVVGIEIHWVTHINEFGKSYSLLSLIMVNRVNIGVGKASVNIMLM